jgi:hypothetical protein
LSRTFETSPPDQIGAHSQHGSVAKSTSRLPAPLRHWFETSGKVRRVVKDWVFRLYFPAQRLSRAQRLRCAPTVLLVEYLVYRVDTAAEHIKHLDLDSARDDDHDAVRRYKAMFDAYKLKFKARLRRMHAYNDAVARQLDMGEEYLYLENKVTSTRAASHSEVLRLAELRPSDVRMLHGMTFALLGRPVDYDLLNLLWPVEVLADIGDDLKTYHQDVAARQFNTYDIFVRLYGRAAPDRMRAEIDRYEQHFRAELSRFPADRRAELAKLCTRLYRARTGLIPEPELPDASRPQQLEWTP